MSYHLNYFQDNEIIFKENKFKYYLSPLLVKNNFKHAFFTKTSSEIELSLLTNNTSFNYDCVLNQVHSNKIVFGSKTKLKKRIEADGIVCDKNNQNLWIYTADCMPILFADRSKRLVAAIHCGRKGLENKIIKSLIKIFYDLGTSKEDLIVAVGPSISKNNYLVDKNTLEKFFKNNKENSISSSNFIKYRANELAKFKKQPLVPLDLKQNAHIQLLNENIPNSNIDISRICTYESNDEFYSWRRSKTKERQWSYISTS